MYDNGFMSGLLLYNDWPVGGFLLLNEMFGFGLHDTCDSGGLWLYQAGCCRLLRQVRWGDIFETGRR